LTLALPCVASALFFIWILVADQTHVSRRLLS